MTTGLEDFFKDCRKNLPAAEGLCNELSRKLPPSYINFLKFSNGIEGSVSNGSYLRLWKAEDLEKLNTTSQSETFVPGMFLIGSDGGEEKIGIDLRENSVTFGNFFRVSSIPLDWKQAVLLGSEVTDIKII